jgi:Holliday junction resolvasome RuvABC endonuclease subunit
MTYVLGIDPGQRHIGWAVLDMCHQRPRWVCGGTTTLEQARRIELLEGLGTVDLAVVETPVAIHRPEANAQLIGTAVMAGRLLEICGWRADHVLEVSPAQWRMSLIGRSKAGDNQDTVVKRTLQASVADLPSRTSVHARDAAGVAIVGWRMWMTRRCMMLEP